WDLVICGTRQETEVAGVLNQLRTHGGGVEYVSADLARAADRTRLADRVRSSVGAVHALVNNAGRAPSVRADLLDGTEQSFEQVLQTNLQGPYFLTQAIAREQIARRQVDSGFAASIVF